MKKIIFILLCFCYLNNIIAQTPFIDLSQSNSCNIITGNETGIGPELYLLKAYPNPIKHNDILTIDIFAKGFSYIRIYSIENPNYQQSIKLKGVPETIKTKITAYYKPGYYIIYLVPKHIVPQGLRTALKIRIN